MEGFNFTRDVVDRVEGRAILFIDRAGATREGELRRGLGTRGSLDEPAPLQDHCKRVTAPYKYPREIAFVDALPKTSSGKVRRVELRARAQAES